MRFPEFACVDCGADTHRSGICEYYMVTNAIWEWIGMGSVGGMLCIGCVETRLRRPLTRGDFSDAPVNSGGFGPQSARLQDRLRA